MEEEKKTSRKWIWLVILGIWACCFTISVIKTREANWEAALRA